MAFFFFFLVGREPRGNRQGVRWVGEEGASFSILSHEVAVFIGREDNQADINMEQP